MVEEKKYPTNLVTCRYCKKKDIDRNKQIKDIDWVNPSVNWFYHADCYKLKKEEEFRKQNKTLRDSMEEPQWKESVYYFLKNDLKIVVDYERFSREWSRLINKGRTPKGIYFALKYFYEIKKHSTDKSNGSIGIVDYIYEESYKYWKERDSREEGLISRIEAQAQKMLNSKSIEIKVRPRNKKNKYSMVDDNDDC